MHNAIWSYKANKNGSMVVTLIVCMDQYSLRVSICESRVLNILKKCFTVGTSPA